MADRPKMPVYQGELTPQELSEEMRRWAEGQGYRFTMKRRAGEFGRIFVQDPKGWYTFTTIPNAHKGRRLRKDQIRYSVTNLNNHWRV